MYCLALELPASAHPEFVAEITYFVLSRNTFVWCFPCQIDCSVCDKDVRRVDSSETSFFFIALPFYGACEMLGSQENTASKFRVSLHHLACCAQH